MRVAKNHPLLDGNKRLAWGCLVMFVMLNGHQLEVPLMTQCRPCWRSLQVSAMKWPWRSGLPTGSNKFSSLRAGDRGQPGGAQQYRMSITQLEQPPPAE